jgi:excisionase family DNA binding protein
MSPTKNPTLQPLLTVRDAAARLNVSTKTIRRRIVDGDIAVVRIGRSVRIDQRALERYVALNWHSGSTRPFEAL